MSNKELFTSTPAPCSKCNTIRSVQRCANCFIPICSRCLHRHWVKDAAGHQTGEYWFYCDACLEPAVMFERINN